MSSALEIVPVSSRSEFASWVRFPREHIYAPHSPWVPPLDRDVARLVDVRHNPYFRHATGALVLAKSPDGHVLGRVLAHVNHSANARFDEHAVSFGFFECVDDSTVATSLMDTVRQFGTARGCTVVRGPFSLGLHQDVGILVDGFEHAPTAEGLYTPPYYPRLLEECGLSPVFTMTTFCIDDVARADCAASQACHGRQMPNVHLRHLRPWDLDHEIEIIRTLANNAFDQSRYFVPITSDEWRYLLQPMRHVVDPSLVLIAERDDEPVAFLLAVPDYNLVLKPLGGRLGVRGALHLAAARRVVRTAVATYAGVRRDLQGQGITRSLFHELIHRMAKRRFEALRVTWSADENHAMQAISRELGGRPMHRLALYEGRCMATCPPGGRRLAHAD